MKRYLFLSTLLLVCMGYFFVEGEENNTPGFTSSSLQILDTIEAVVLTQEGTELVTRSDLQRPGLQGNARQLDDIIFELLVDLDAKKHKIDPDEDAVDRYLAKIMQENGMSLADLEELFRQGGRTLQEGREELRRMQAVNSMIDFKIRSNVIVPRKQVEAYYDAHPEYESARYYIRYAYVPFKEELLKRDQKKELMALVREKKVGKIPFGDPFWIDQNDIAPEKQFIITMQKGGIKIEQTSTGFELYHLQNKSESRLKTLEERYLDIATILRQPKYEQMLQDYRIELFEKSSIVYLT